MYPYPYQEYELSQALTQRLKDQLHQIRTQNCHIKINRTQAESHELSTRNINSDLVTVASSELVEWRGEHNIPKRYLKSARWLKQGSLGEGYYAPGEKDNKGKNVKTPVDFNFNFLQWGISSEEKDKIRIDRPTPVLLGLQIYDDERVDRSQWGPIDGEPDKEEIAVTQSFRFGSDNEDDNTPAEDRDKYIPPNDEAELTEAQIAELACLFPTTASIKPKVLPLDTFPSLANQMSSIMSTTTHVLKRNKNVRSYL